MYFVTVTQINEGRLEFRPKKLKKYEEQFRIKHFPHLQYKNKKKRLPKRSKFSYTEFQGSYTS